jgi:hypothetical protein
VVCKKYIHPETVEEWIRNLVKGRSNCSIIWKSMLNSFLVIGEGLAWRVGKGNKVRVGANAWPGSGNSHILLDELVRKLNTNGYFYLSQVVDQFLSSIWSQEWKEVDHVGIGEGFYEVWATFTRALKRAHIRIT